MKMYKNKCMKMKVTSSEPSAIQFISWIIIKILIFLDHFLDDNWEWIKYVYLYIQEERMGALALESLIFIQKLLINYMPLFSVKN